MILDLIIWREGGDPGRQHCHVICHCTVEGGGIGIPHHLVRSHFWQLIHFTIKLNLQVLIQSLTNQMPIQQSNSLQLPKYSIINNFCFKLQPSGHHS